MLKIQQLRHKLCIAERLHMPPANTNTHTQIYCIYIYAHTLMKRQGYKNYKGNKAQKKPKSHILVFPPPKARGVPFPQQISSKRPLHVEHMEILLYIDEMTD